MFKRGHSATKTRIVGALLLSLIGFCHTAIADTPSPTPNPNESQLVEHGHYVNKDGDVIHSPAHTVTGQAPPGATAHCRDGSYSFSAHRQGTCSHHGGVSTWVH
jgi:hypothetical protein